MLILRRQKQQQLLRLLVVKACKVNQPTAADIEQLQAHLLAAQEAPKEAAENAADVDTEKAEKAAPAAFACAEGASQDKRTCLLGCLVRTLSVMGSDKE
jgi:hypothetical protein